jgi:hypothetical protein
MAAAKKKSTELAQLTSEDLLPAEVEFDELIENLEDMDEIEFPRIRFRQGKFFFSDDPEDKGVEEFEGVVFFYGKQNTYWAGAYDPGNVLPPECFSVDGKEGTKARNEDGEFGACKTCKFNQFGSGMGKGKACRNQVKLYIQRLGTTVPMTLFLAPTSIGNFMQNYLMNKVTQKGLSYSRVVTKIKSYQQGTETYYRVNFEVAGVFKGEEAAKVKQLRDYWMNAIKSDRTRLENHDSDSDSSASSGSNSGSSSNTRVVTPREPAPVSAGADDVSSDDDDDPPF